MNQTIFFFFQSFHWQLAIINCALIIEPLLPFAWYISYFRNLFLPEDTAHAASCLLVIFVVGFWLQTIHPELAALRQMSYLAR